MALPDLQSRIDAARAALDEQVREIVAWHFDPATGCPFWLDYAKDRLGWDPRDRIGSFEDLRLLPPFEDEWLRGGPVRRWVPRGLADKPVYVFETGGTTGVPKSRINVEDFRTDYAEFSKTLPDEFFPPGADWLHLGPSGPRRLRLAVEYLAQVRGGICFSVDLDPRWVVKLLKRGHYEEAERYKQHCLDQALTILKAHPGVQCIFATPKLLEGLCERTSLKKFGITGVFCGGTEMTPEFHRFAREELLEGAYFAATYGNTLMGLACHKPFDPADNYAIIYYPPQPRAALEVCNPENLNETVGYLETGRAVLTTLTKEFFMPRFPERDSCEREPPSEMYPWDGVRNVRPYQDAKSGSVTVGVY